MEENSKKDGDNMETVKIIYKRPEYLLESQRKQYNKNKDNPEYKEKERARIRKYREANREHINEMERLRRQRKREEQKQVTKDKKDVSNLTKEFAEDLSIS